MLQFNQITRTLPGNPARPLFSGLSGEARLSDTISFTGPSGTGKSTLLRILALLESPDEGRLILNGRPAREWDARQWRMKLSYVSQQPFMLSGTVEDNLRAASALHRTPFDRELASRLMASLGMAETDWRKNAQRLSGGEKQRVSLVRTLLLRPEMLLLDEITASLDDTSTEAVERLLRSFHEAEGTGFIWITHDLEQAGRVAGRSWVLAEGRITEGEYACP
ncbi:ABC transporter ATP-binding protein [Paenibacillus darwinianus]|nr:ATP-binding cassette domain-containing protein [Paenibacillus darwinianus]